MLEQIQQNYNTKKLTKKEYYNLNCNIHYFIGTVYKNNRTNKYNINFEDLRQKIFNDNTFNNIDYLEQNCLKYIGISQNTIDFKHLKIEDNKIISCYEPKKGSYYKIELTTGLILIIHEYKDNCNTLTFKVIDPNNKYN